MKTFPFIDTHCHFDFPPFIDDAARSIHVAHDAGVEKMIVPAVDIASIQRIIALQADFPMFVHAAFGLHPCFSHSQAEHALLTDFVAKYHSKLVALGEIGLDAMIDTPLTTQIALFETQLILAKQYQLPVILHSRRTHETLYKILKHIDLPAKGTIHGFAGSYEQAKRFIDLGFHIGVGGVITYPRAQKTRETIKKLPLSSLLLETDAPDMPVLGYQGQPNRPERISLIFDSLCELRSESREDIKETIYLSTCTQFF